MSDENKTGVEMSGQSEPIAGHSVASSQDDPFLSNSAAHPDGVIVGEPKYPDCCDDTLMFGMRDNHHAFSIGLSTILECLRYAEREGEVPRLPEGWWNLLETRYPALQHLDHTSSDATD